MPLNPLQLIHAFTPGSAGTAHAKLVSKLLANAEKRDDSIYKQMLLLADRKFGGDQLAAMQSEMGQRLESGRAPVSMARDNLFFADQARKMKFLDEDLLLAADDANKQHLASLRYSDPSYHANVRGVPENSVYVQGLSSEVPGGGTQLLKELESRYPGAAMHLQSLNIPETKQFYLRKGFHPMPDGSSSVIEKNMWVKPADVKIRAAAATPLAAMGSEDKSVTDAPTLWDKTKGAVSGGLGAIWNAMKDPLSIPAMGMGASGEAYKHGGLARCNCGRT